MDDDIEACGPGGPSLKRSHRVNPLLAALLAGLVPCSLSSAASAFAIPDVGDASLQRIELARSEGRIDEDQALLLSLRRVFSPETLPAEYSATSSPPLHCATLLVREAEQRLPLLSDDDRQTVTNWLQPHGGLKLKSAGYLSPSGLFVLEYALEGVDAVPTEDVEPANGVPDFVERVALYFDRSWARQVVELGFVAPDLQGVPYPIGFQSMGAYGYTTTASAGPAGTRIVLHNDFVGFPANEDPESNPLGAAKVTAAHEFKHAIQFATSHWSETGTWVEVDATWVEDIVFDPVNDYYNYLGGGSPIAAPGSSLDAGGSGSYDDCVWQHWMGETWGETIVVELWERRGLVPSEPMLASYQWVLQEFGATLEEDFVDFAAWNYATGERARSGFGYEEAASFPTSPTVAAVDTLPAAVSGAVNHLAADFVLVTGLESAPGQVRLTVRRQFASPVRLAVLVDRTDGGWSYERLALSSTEDVVTLSTPREQIASFGIVVANGAASGGTRTWSIQIDEIPHLPVPIAYLGDALPPITVVEGGSASLTLPLSNVGEAGSELSYEVQVLAAVPGSVPQPPHVERTIAGTVLTPSVPTYDPATSVDLILSVTNASTDLEWLSEIRLSIPAGVRVTSSTAFVGGSAGDLVSNGAVGEAVTLVWADTNGGWGNVKHGETAAATVSLSFDLSLFGDLAFAYEIVGDGYGQGPHQIQDTMILRGPTNPLMDLHSPDGGEWLRVGDTVNLNWVSADPGDVRLEMSRDGGIAWEALAASTENDGIFAWTVSGPPSAACRFRVSSLDSTVSDMSAADVVVYEGVDWLTVSPSPGTIGAGQEAALALDVDALLLSPGTYDATLRIVNNGPDGPLMVPVRLTVTETVTPIRPAGPSTAMHGTAPNPFNPVTRIAFSLARSSRVRLDVYDVRGRHVRALIDGRLEGGEHEVPWTGEDTRGQKVASGRYLAILVTDGQRLATSMTLVK